MKRNLKILLPVVPRVRAQILAQFMPLGMEEHTLEYYYDVLDLCGRVDPNMEEAVKPYSVAWAEA
ncbi:hypothetical protein OUZ56_029513 [Daphnia magna]|uniref:Uncharacterized protein n=1 Tax=Daphnia magna TaxID=35525 RepID=A0ABR0B710_9CRUS|nr:hypothetical protein OUZ56_029513 [Daphnia magna]